jgi:uncharacterized membrane protein
LEKAILGKNWKTLRKKNFLVVIKKWNNFKNFFKLFCLFMSFEKAYNLSLAWNSL